MCLKEVIKYQLNKTKPDADFKKLASGLFYKFFLVLVGEKCLFHHSL